MSESPVTSGDEIADHQVIIRGGQVEAVVVPLEEYRALKALEQREAELYWAVHEARYPSRPGDDAPDGKVYDSMDALLTDLSSDGMKYVRTAGFLADLRRLLDEHRKMFAAAVHELLRPALDAGAHTGAAP